MINEEKLLNKIETNIANVRGFIAAFNVNIDSIHLITEGEITELFRNMDQEEKVKVLEYMNNPSYVIRSPTELLAGLAYVICNEKTAEWNILNREVHEWIKNRFKPDSLRIGGQAGNIAYQLAKLGIKRVYVSIPRLSLTQAKMYSGLPNIFVPSISNNKIEFKHPLDAIYPEDEDLIHWIFEIPKNLKFDLIDKRCRSNTHLRFIATWDEVTSRLEFKEEFKKGSVEIVKEADYAVASGYHLLRREYSDGSTPEEHVQKTLNLLKSWKEINPSLKIHYEHGFTGDSELLRVIYDNLPEVIDCVGLNEVELPLILKTYGLNREAEDIWKNPSSLNLFKGLLKMSELTAFKRLTLHTKDFSMSLMSREFDLDLENEVEGLIFGSLTAASTALNGVFSDLNEIRHAAEKLSLSRYGVEQMNRLSEYLRDYGGELRISRDSMTSYLGDFSLSYAAARVVPSPVATVGLGDAFTAGLLTVEAFSQRH